MTKRSPEARILWLMDDVGWKGVTNWTSLRPELQQKEILPFQQWVRKNLPFVPGPRARDALEKYYILHESLDTSKGAAVYLREGKSCLITAYMKDQAYAG